MIRNKQKLLVSVVLAAVLLLAGCGQQDAVSAPVAAAETEAPPTPTPLVELDVGGSVVRVDAETLELSDGRFTLEALCAAAKKLPSVTAIRLGETALGPDGLVTIRASYPAARVSWQKTVEGYALSDTTETLDLSSAGSDSIAALCLYLPLMDDLREINTVGADGYTALSFEDLAQLRFAAAAAKLAVRFSLYGLDADNDTKELRYERKNIGNDGVAVFRSVLPYLDSLELLRVKSCGITDYDGMEALKNDFTNVNVVFSVEIRGWPFMTDTTLINSPRLLDENVHLLKYMHDVLYLDIGHNGYLTNVEFVRYFPKLQVAIVSLTNISDISPFEACPDIEFFECITTPISDISVLAGMEKLEYVNIGAMKNLADISPLYGKQSLKQVRICGTTYNHVTREQVEELKASLPETCFVSDGGGDPTTSGQWRFKIGGGYTERYALLREQMQYDFAFDDRQCNSPSA